MATDTTTVALTTAAYVALTAANSVSVWLKRGQRCRIVVGESLPDPSATAYILAEGPSTNRDGPMAPFDFGALTASSGVVYARADDVDISVLVVRIESS